MMSCALSIIGRFSNIIWTTHNITNVGEEELITLFWINEPYNQLDSDTYFEEV